MCSSCMTPLFAGQLEASVAWRASAAKIEVGCAVWEGLGKEMDEKKPEICGKTSQDHP